jgi:TPR repeat protein
MLAILASVSVICAQPNPEALYQQGHAAERSAQSPEEYAAASRFYQSAIAQGHVPSKVALGFLYERGAGLPVDRATALRLYTEAADSGDIAGRVRAAQLLLRGDAGVTDPTRARRYLALNANAGDQLSQFMLASLLMTGKGGGRNALAARRWFQAASNGSYAPLASKAIQLGNQIEQKIRNQAAPTGWSDFAGIVAVIVGLGIMSASNSDGSSSNSSAGDPYLERSRKMNDCSTRAWLGPSKDWLPTYWSCMAE